MATKVLVLGGTRFFGVKLVNRLIAAGMDVTITTRGNSANPFGNAVRHVKVNRENKDALQAAVGQENWDIVFDNICYASKEANEACEIFQGRVGKYVLTSTLSVYGLGENQKEEEVDTTLLPIQIGTKEDFTYQEGKQMAEAVFFQRATFPVVAMRIPIVLGLDDYTGRLKFHVDHVQNEIPMQVGNVDARMSYILSDEVADFLFWLGSNDLTGAINASADGTVSMKELLSLIEEATGKKANIVLEADTEHRSPYALPSSYYMDTTKTKKSGYTFSTLLDWLPKLVQQMVVNKE